MGDNKKIGTTGGDNENNEEVKIKPIRPPKKRQSLVKKIGIAVLCSLLLVYVLLMIVGVFYRIPSSTLEKTLLVGDHVWVNKMFYSARNVERGDIVVFNFPAGDTVCEDLPNPDYYTQVFDEGRDAVWANHKVTYCPVDLRDNYMQRCLGLPGETLKIVNGIVNINGKDIPEPKNVQYNYAIKVNGNDPDYDFLTNELGIANEDMVSNMAVDPMSGQLSTSPDLNLPLTAEMKAKLEKCNWVTSVTRAQYGAAEGVRTYPLGVDYGWTHNDYGPIWVPKKGASIDLNEKNLQLYARCIKNYEGANLEIKGDKAYIDGKPALKYTFKMDYYWMMGDNRDNSFDSRFWGFVPEDHIVGTPMFVIFSFDKDRGLTDGRIRWNRIFIDANPDK